MAPMDLKFILLNLLALWTSTKSWAELKAVEDGRMLKVSGVGVGHQTFLSDGDLAHEDHYRLEIPIAQLQKGSTSDPEQTNQFSEETLLAQANDLFHERRYTDALKLVDVVLSRKPENFRAWSMKGSLLHSLGDQVNAQAAWSRSLSLHPNQPELRRALSASSSKGARP